MATKKPTYLNYDEDDNSRPYQRQQEKVYRPSPPIIARSGATTRSSSSSTRPTIRPTTRSSIVRSTPSAVPGVTPIPRIQTVDATGGGGSSALLWVVLLLVPILLVVGWLYTVNLAQSKYPKLRNKRICLLIAHPDDEAMFFAPSVVALTEPSLGNHVKILCLSSGDADGLGETRKRELVKSGLKLGLRQEDDVFVVESPDFPDSMTTEWSAPKISSLLSSAFAPSLQLPASPKSSTQPTATIDVLITFDSAGISSHPNHISLFHGAKHFITSLVQSRPGWDCPVALYTLTTVNVVRKYSSFVDALLLSIGTSSSDSTRKESKTEQPGELVFIGGVAELRRAQRAMTEAHISQMRWFRWGWIGLSRYMVVNDLRLERIVRKPEVEVEVEVEKEAVDTED